MSETCEWTWFWAPMTCNPRFWVRLDGWDDYPGGIGEGGL